MREKRESEREGEKRKRERERPFSANVKTNATPPTCSCVVGERRLLSSSAATCCAGEHVSNSIGIDELVTLISFPYIVGLSVLAVNSRRALFMRSAARRGGSHMRRLLRPFWTFPKEMPPFDVKPVSFHSRRPLIAFAVNCVRFYLPKIGAVDDLCRPWTPLLILWRV